MYPARLYPALVALALAACQIGPTNGTTATGPVIGKSFLFQGYFNEPSAVITLQVLNNPANDPAVAANWAPFATATSSTTPTFFNNPDPLYFWSVTAAPVPNVFLAARWPQGGLVRVRALHSDPTNGDIVLTTFDDVTFSDCLNQQLAVSASWQTIGAVCQGVGKATAALVSTTNIPVAAGTAATFSGFLGKKGAITSADTATYYLATGAPTTLASFRATFGFPTGEVTATYYNDGDLGLGRETHCKTIGRGLACYVTTYSGIAGQPAFNQDPNVVLADAVARVHSFATLAMTYDGTTDVNSVKFVAYDAAGNLATTVQLDSTGNNKSIPNSCLSCHGIGSSFNIGSKSVSGDAKFLPLDPFSFQYSTAAGFTFNDQADEIRQLNALVKSANPSLATAQLINGMYAPSSVSDPAAIANNTFIPDAWKTFNDKLDGTTLYNGFVKVGCRTCHVSAVNPAIDFNSPDDVTALIGTLRDEVCGTTHIMPHSERAMKKFWESGARAYLVTGFGPSSFPDPLQACKP